MNEVDAVRIGSYLVILKCPWCGERHAHKRGAEGVVVPQCPPKRAPRDGYVLKEVNDGSS